MSDPLIGSIPNRTPAELADMQSRAEQWLANGSDAQKATAGRVLAAIRAHLTKVADEENAKTEALYQRLMDAPIQRRVIEAFTARPLTENERKTVQALMDHPGSTTTELSRACGNDSMIWQMHFGNLCKDRQAYLWPAEMAEHRGAPFFSGILAEVDAENRFTMKPEVAAAFAELGLKPRSGRAA